jgi:hypothetical protein
MTDSKDFLTAVALGRIKLAKTCFKIEGRCTVEPNSKPRSFVDGFQLRSYLPFPGRILNPP